MAGAGSPVGNVTLPAYVPFKGPSPDLSGNAQGLDPAYFRFPQHLVQSVSRPPGDGSTVTAITQLPFAPPPPMEQNAAWQAVNKALSATLQMDQVPVSEYQTKLNALIAGSQLPDFIFNPTTINPWGDIPQLPQFLNATCTDLTPYLSGDAVKDYPNLANYSTYSWHSAVSDHKIYALPIARPPVNAMMCYRADIFDKAGVPLEKAPKDANEFKRMLQAVNRPQDMQYGIASGQVLPFGLVPGGSFLAIFRVPNNWRLDAAGKLIKDFESEEYRAAVGFARDLWQLGVWNPNTPTYGGTITDDFIAGRFAVFPTVWGGYVQYWDIAAARYPAARVYPMHPFANDGGKPQCMAGSGNFGLTYIKQQASPERLKMLLRIANFFAAPFGTTEWLLNYFGARDVDFTYDDIGAPGLTDQGRSELIASSGGWRYVSSPAYALFSAYRSQEFATVSQSAESAMLAALEPDPTLGLYSPTAAAQSIVVQDRLMAGVSDIVQGRRPLSDLDGLVADWRNSAGDKMRAEFQEQLQKA
jgi:putative aldouronate transport system substrate-binding protein